MKIYIDESGIFKAEMKSHSISCVTALIIPDNQETALIQAFHQWKQLTSLQYKTDKYGEIKGSKLDEKEMASLLLILSRFDVLVETVCIDAGMTTDSDVTRLKIDIADSFSKSQLSKILNIQFKKNVLMSLPQQLFLQSLSLYQLLHKVLETMIPYYAQRFPQELGTFDWILDAKGISITEFEKIITHLVNPFLQNIFFNNPLYCLENGDYTAFNKFSLPREYLVEPLRSNISGTSNQVYSISDIMKNISFEQSHNSVGLQIVDIITSCIKRGMKKNLKFEGWKFLSSLIVLRKEQAIRVICINPARISKPAPYTKFVNYFQEYGKTMLVPNNIKIGSKGYINWSYLDKIVDSKFKSIYLEYY